jgi:two-component system nitrogen regulation response regulator GlnG
VVSYEPLLQSEDYDLGIVGRCEKMQSVFKLIGQLSASDATALITGESGTGKELVARAVYSHSQRAGNPFIAINCAAIPENLLESELFGHERGAFTGAANQRIGKFEQCNHGTVFLDEIGDMTLATQTKILRVLQSGTFERVGGNQPIKVDVRVIAATNKPLEEAVAKKEFREDLFYRLNVVRIAMPPLRERPDDVRLLVNYFLARFAKEEARPPRAISGDALKLLEGHHWPGNVRELENVMRRALVVSKGDAILASDLPPEIIGPRNPGTKERSVHTVSPIGSLEEADMATLARALFQHARRDPKLKVIPSVERELIVQALLETEGNQVHASKLLGITRATLRKRIDRFGIRQELAIQ